MRWHVTFLTRLDETIRGGVRLFLLWLFGDVIFAVLPILVLAAITVMLGEPFDSFFEIKEWCFATIVLYGVTIRKFMYSSSTSVTLPPFSLAFLVAITE